MPTEVVENERPDAFERIMASLYDAMIDDTHWPATSALIDEACGITGNVLLVGEGPKDDIRASFVGLYSRGQRREDEERSTWKSTIPSTNAYRACGNCPTVASCTSPTCTRPRSCRPRRPTTRSCAEATSRLAYTCAWTGRMAPTSAGASVIPWPRMVGGLPRLRWSRGYCPISGNISASGRRWSVPRRGQRPCPPCSITSDRHHPPGPARADPGG